MPVQWYLHVFEFQTIVMFFDMCFGMFTFPIPTGAPFKFRFGLTLRSAQGHRTLKGGHDWNGVIPVGNAVVFQRWSDRRHDGAGRVLCLSGPKCFENEETQGKWRGNAMEGEKSGNWEGHVSEFFCTLLETADDWFRFWMMDTCNGGNTKLSNSALSHVCSCVHGAGTSIQLKLWEGPHRIVTNLNDCTRTWRSGWVRRSPLWRWNEMEKWKLDWKRPNLRKPRLGTEPEVSSDQFSLVHYLIPGVKNYFSI